MGYDEPAAMTLADRPPRWCPGSVLIAGLGWLLARLPPGLWPGFGRIGAVVLWPLLRGRRRVAARNLELCFPDLPPSRRRRLLRASIAATVTSVIETGAAWFGPRGRASRICEVRGLEHLRAVLAQGRGALLLTTHQLPMELGARALSERLGQRLDALARRHNSRCMQALFARGRARFIDRLLDKKDLRGLLTSLRENRVVVLIGDQDFNRHHAFVPFFGVPAATLAVTAPLARASAAPVLPAWAWRQAPGRYVVEIEPPLPGVADAAPQAEAARYMTSLEIRVRRHPEQYLWLHKRFKTRPPGEPPLY